MPTINKVSISETLCHHRVLFNLIFVNTMGKNEILLF